MKTTSKNEDDLKDEDDLKNEDIFKNEDNLKNEYNLKTKDDFKNENDLKNKDDLKKLKRNYLLTKVGEGGDLKTSVFLSVLYCLLFLEVTPYCETFCLFQGNISPTKMEMFPTSIGKHSQYEW